VKANTTVTFHPAKTGLYLNHGKPLRGELRVVNIGLPPRLIAEDPSPYRLMTLENAAVPVKDPLGHKYTFGSVLVVAGCKRMPGAALLTVQGAMRAGAGLVTLAAPSSVFAQAVPAEIIRLPLTRDDVLCVEDVDRIAAERCHALIVGPGLGRHPDTQAALEKLFEALSDHPMIVDADALNALAQSPRPLNLQCVLTPHVAEAARLLDSTPEAVQADLLASAEQLRERYQAQVVLKSATTVVATADGCVYINPLGNPGMATAGSGDVLAGVLGAMASQKLTPVSGVFAHSMAGDQAARVYSEYGLAASDIARFLPEAIKTLAISAPECSAQRSG
jgi:NAD(P)H-hydrate epimerase